ncbi:hypothetical protein GT348_04590 [Aristophania vespae]|uniref:3-deoxy-D-manno-octulosonic acid transferase n=1 Tax=Aristophania vespae TaxID=2697033 RepID=A0A6P1NFF6_9PROT|nr:glycosyltransferase N-terminal domain-containing protein [Aristophania vespae]QHI95637.1 hypothetical protein GT348_04590 [Aristophania vespae]
MPRPQKVIEFRTFIFAFWDWVGWCLTPALIFYCLGRLKKGKEQKGRLKERFGFISADQHLFYKQHNNRFIWFHAASVGETLSAFSLIDMLLENDKNISILFTTNTITGFSIISTHVAYGKRLIHSFMPYDIPAARKRFLNYWQPCGAVFIESEIWPGYIKDCAKRAIPFMVVNARLSQKTVKKWLAFKYLFRLILSEITWIMPRGKEDQRSFEPFDPPILTPIGDLKEEAPPLTYDRKEFTLLKKLVEKRKVFVAASTHKGEEAIIIEALKRARWEEPDLLGIIVPRHPERGAEIATLFQAPRRSLGEVPSEQDFLWVIDTLGELGLFFKLADLAFIGNSLCPQGVVITLLSL